MGARRASLRVPETRERHLSRRSRCARRGRPPGGVGCGFGWDVHWSPDSTRFATWIDFWETIAVYDLDGERLALLPACGQRSGDHDPRFSLDGRSIVVPNCEIPIDGGDPESDPGYRDVYSPDGTRVARVTHSGDGETFDAALVIEETDGTVLQVVDEASSPARGTTTSSGRPRVNASCSAGHPARTVVASWMRPPSFARSTSERAGHDDRCASGDPAHPGSRLMVIGSCSRPGTAPAGAERNTGLWSMDADGSHMQLLVPDTGRGDWQPQPGSD